MKSWARLFEPLSGWRERFRVYYVRILIVPTLFLVVSSRLPGTVVSQWQPPISLDILFSLVRREPFHQRSDSQWKWLLLQWWGARSVTISILKRRLNEDMIKSALNEGTDLNSNLILNSFLVFFYWCRAEPAQIRRKTRKRRKRLGEPCKQWWDSSKQVENMPADMALLLVVRHWWGNAL